MTAAVTSAWSCTIVNRDCKQFEFSAIPVKKRTILDRCPEKECCVAGNSTNQKTGHPATCCDPLQKNLEWIFCTRGKFETFVVFPPAMRPMGPGADISASCEMTFGCLRPVDPGVVNLTRCKLRIHGESDICSENRKIDGKFVTTVGNF